MDKKSNILQTSVPGETPAQLASRLLSGKIDTSKFFQNAESHSWKGLPVPSFMVRKVLSSAKSDPTPYLRSLQKVNKDTIIKTIQNNPEVFRSVKAPSFLPSAKIAKPSSK